MNLYQKSDSKRLCGAKHLKMTNKTGFTLIELLVVVLIIGILSAVALPQYTQAVEKARASEAFVLVKAMKDAQDLYRLANTPQSVAALEDLDIEIPGVYTPGVGVSSSFTRTKNFKLTILSNGNPHAFRLDNAGRSLYQIAYYYGSGAFNCYAFDDKSISLCKALGGVPHTGCQADGVGDDRCFLLK